MMEDNIQLNANEKVVILVNCENIVWYQIYWLWNIVFESNREGIFNRNGKIEFCTYVIRIKIVKPMVQNVLYP